MDIEKLIVSLNNFNPNAKRNIGVTSSFLTEVKNEDAIPLLFMHVSLSFLLFFGFTDMLFIRIFRICKYN